MKCDNRGRRTADRRSTPRNSRPLRWERSDRVVFGLRWERSDRVLSGVSAVSSEGCTASGFQLTDLKCHPMLLNIWRPELGQKG